MRPSVYEGEEPYLFISYAHKDTEPVFRVLEALRADHLRLWYDEGIAPGSEWPENVASHLYHAAVVLAFITPQSMASENCRREINFALSKQKPFLSIVLEETQMPLGMEMQLSAKQSILRYNFPTWEGFVEKILRCEELAACREGAAGAAAPSPVPEIIQTAAALAEKGDHAGELRTLLSGLDIAPDDGSLLVKIGRAYRRNDQREKALEYYEKAMAVDPGDCTIYSNIGAVYLTAGQYGKARPWYEKSLAKLEENPLRVSQGDVAVIYGNYALCVGMLGDLSAARKNLRIARERGYSPESIQSICQRLGISPKSLDRRFRFF